MKHVIIGLLIIGGCAPTTVLVEPDLLPIYNEIDSLYYYSDVQGFMIEALFGIIEEESSMYAEIDSMYYELFGREGYYTVKEGDSLWKIAEQELGDPYLWINLHTLNGGFPDPGRIYPGQILKLNK